MKNPDNLLNYDVIIVGAGISGIGAAYHLKDQCPNKSFIILESLDKYGGTWYTHTYPGIRSDSDLYTFGYRFKPWIGPPIATAEEIQDYLEEVIEDNGIKEHISYNRHVNNAKWDSESSLWTLEVEEKETGEIKEYSSNFLWMCQGYYDHEKGYIPDWKGIENFKGQLIHPQNWTENIDYKDKEVVVIGSGATTATIVPAMAPDCKHITVLQRSPTYFIPGMNQQKVANFLRFFKLKEEWVHSLTRLYILLLQRWFVNKTFKHPEKAKKQLIDGVREYLDPGYDVETHFTPTYRPWRQRIAFVPEGDIFQGIKSGKASMVTDQIDRFEEDGILLKSGEEIKTDFVISATGFNLSLLGNIDFYVDNQKVDFSKKVTYRGMMITDIPNMLWIFGYFRASWTLRVDLMGDFVCRLLKYMDSNGFASATPFLSDKELKEPLQTWIDEENFNPGYLVRSQHKLPKRIKDSCWQHTQDYWEEKKDIPAIDLAKAPFTYK
jgi:cation diffusion facilitator CzcD-associated flavoprotein CzcO